MATLTYWGCYQILDVGIFLSLASGLALSTLSHILNSRCEHSLASGLALSTFSHIPNSLCVQSLTSKSHMLKQFVPILSLSSPIFHAAKCSKKIITLILISMILASHTQRQGNFYVTIAFGHLFR